MLLGQQIHYYSSTYRYLPNQPNQPSFRCTIATIAANEPRNKISSTQGKKRKKINISKNVRVSKNNVKISGN